MQLKQIEQSLRRCDYAGASAESARVFPDVYERLGPGDNSAYTLAIAVLYRAVAESGLGADEDAIWHRDVAVALYPNFAGTDLSVFCAAGKRLMAHPIPARSPCIPGDQVKPRSRAAVSPFCKALEDHAPKLRAPHLRHQVAPVFTAGAKVFKARGTVSVEVEIGADGKIRAPRVLKALSVPSLSFAALEALRQWRFDPATHDGQPVAVRFVLVVRYQA